MGDIKYERRRTALSQRASNEDIDDLFYQVKIICKSQLKLQYLIEEYIEIIARKNNICNNTSLISIHKMSFKFLEIAI